DAIRDKLVLGENVSQAAHFLQSRSADAGLISLSLAMSLQLKNNGRYWLVPDHFHPPLRQAVVILTSSNQKEEARNFLDFLRSVQGRTILERHGFSVPGGNK